LPWSPCWASSRWDRPPPEQLGRVRPGSGRDEVLHADADQRGQRQEPQAAWTFHTGDTSGFFESGLIVIDGVMYFSAPNGVYALDAATGTQIWKYETTGTARRGPLYWPGGNGVGPRIFSQTESGMAAIDPKDGKLITSFGEKGFVTGLRMTSPPVAYKNILVTQGGNSTVKAWDAVTGEQRWVLNLKAQPGDPAASTWLGDSLKTAGGPGLWGYFSVDVERGLILCPSKKSATTTTAVRTTGTTSTATAFLPSTPTPERSSGTNSSSIMTSGISTLPRQPALIDIRRNGRTIPACR
jgi:glucose dehydrogenase